jgi:hypothetical protein
MKNLLLMPLIFFGCQSAPKKGEMFTPAAPTVKWETKAQLKDFKQNKTDNLSIDIVAIQDSHARLEVAATMGYPVASIVTSPKQMRMAVYTQKKFFWGPNNENALKPALGISIDPKIFHNIIFDTPIKGWTCENNQAGQVSVCKKSSPSGEMVVAWPERKDGSKRVIIRAPQFEMQWLFKSHNVVSQLAKETFQLEPPKGYKVISL